MVGLTSFAVGLAATRALRGRTMAENRVHLEPNVAIAVTAPTLCVYVAGGETEVEGRALLDASGNRVRFELLLPPVVVLATGQQEAQLDMNASAALAFALFWRQCMIALQADQNVWSGLWRSFVPRIHSLVSGADLIELEKGQKIPARIVELVIEPLSEPSIGAEPAGVWAELLAAMRAEGGELSVLADLLQTAITGTVVLDDWRADFARLGLSFSLGEALGVGLAEHGAGALLDGPAIVEELADPTLTEPQS
ncbi:hypothetical protein [Methylosinus sp. Sm6]|uniref:hypothetical protein n=1 Tax=Methylosinus sp. Sm6 TaxID=2866948 RepID=UPI001C998219|nr:hypothetical protein [Methylosinus sp. Sm6]MBY6239811.1 hypothetical protein [Methylosinus sp. Sm6]